MKQYLVFFKLKFIIGLQYRMAALAGLVTQFFFGIVFILVYVSFYESNNSAPMKLDELITYLWLGQSFFALMFLYYKDNELLEMIKNGNIAYELCRPQNLYIKWFTKTISTKLASAFLRCFPVLIVSLLLPRPYNLSLPVSIESFLLFILSMIIGTFLVSAIATLYHIITFFTIDEKGVLGMLMVIADLFAGSIVPIPFLPNFLQMISKYLPFAYIFDLPYRIYSGNIGVNVALLNILIQFIWLIVIVFIGYILTNKALKRVVVQGG